MLPPLLTILASLDPLLRERAIAAAQTRDERLVVIRHELTSIEVDGCVHRLVERDGACQDVALEVSASCCLSCLLRDDAEAVLTSLRGQRVLLALPPSVEPANVSISMVDAGVARLGTIAVTVDARRLEARLSSTSLLDTLEDLGDDPRSVAEVLARHLEHADTVLHAGADDREATLIDALSGQSPQRQVDDPDWLSAGDHDHDRFRARLQPGVPRCRSSVRRAGVEQRCWHRRRPLHPERLLDLVESDDLHGLIRASGWIWVATRPSTVLELEANPGSYEVGVAGVWMDAVGDHSSAHPARRDHARRSWHPYYGDRAQALVLTSTDRDLDEIVDRLDACLLTDAELSHGPDSWRSWPDPLTPWLGDEAELLSSPPKDLR